MSIIVRKIAEALQHANAYFVDSPGHSCLIDPGISLRKHPDENPDFLLATHGHFDHVAQADIWRKKKEIHMQMHLDDQWLIQSESANASAFFGLGRSFKPAELTFQDGERIFLGTDYFFEVIHSPGHTQGSSCFLLQEKEGKALALFTGDTVFADNVGRCDLAGGNWEVLKQSLVKLKARLLNLDPNLPVYPGHGRDTTVALLLAENTYLQ